MSTSQTASAMEGDLVVVCLRDFGPLLGNAMKQQRAFLKDFADDRVHISRDVYEVLVAYRRCAMEEAS